MADIAGNYSKSSAYPYVTWTISYNQTSRNASSASYSITARMQLDNGQSYGYGFNLYADVYQGGTKKGTITLKSDAYNDNGGSMAGAWARSGSFTFDTDANGGSIGGIRINTYSTQDGSRDQQIDISGSVNKSTFNTAPYWANGASASINQSGIIPENITRLTINWSELSDNEGGNKQYTVQRFINGSLNRTVLDWGTNTTSVYDDIGANNYGSKYFYRIFGRDSYGVQASGYIQTNEVTINTFNMPSASASTNIGWSTGEFFINSSGASNSNGNGSFTYSYDSLTNGVSIYNNTGSSRFYISESTTAGPYIKKSELKNITQNNSWQGTVNFRVYCSNAYGTTKYTDIGVWVDLRTAPNNASNLRLSSSGTYHIPGKYTTSLAFNAGSDNLGRAVNYDIQYSYDNNNWTTCQSQVAYANSFNLPLPRVSSASVFYVRVITRTDFGWTNTSGNVSSTAHYYDNPTIILTNYARNQSDASVTATFYLHSSIGLTWNSKQCINRANNTINITGDAYTLNEPSLTESTTFRATFKCTDSLGTSVLVYQDFKAYIPIIDIRSTDIGGVSINASPIVGNVLTVGGNAGIYGKLFVGGSIGQLAGQLASGADFNNFLTEGEYSVGGDNLANAPFTGSIYGKLIVKVNDGGTHNNNNNWIWQIFYRTGGNQLFRRSKTNGGAWTGWSQDWNTGNLNPDIYYVKDSINPNWFRSSGNVGWYNQTYGGGWYMTDSSWIRAYNNKGIHTEGKLSTSSGLDLALNNRVSWSSPNDIAEIFAEHSGTATRLVLNTADDGEEDCTVIRNTHYTGNKDVAVFGRDNIFFNSNLRCSRILGINTNNVYIGGGAGRMENTPDNYVRLYSSSAGNADCGINVSPNGAVEFKSYNNTIHQFRADGGKTGGSIELEGSIYGMSPTDSPRSLIEDIYFNYQLKSGMNKVLINNILAKSLYEYAIFTSNSSVVVKEKCKDYFNLFAAEDCILDIRIVGIRIDYKDQYYQLMGGIEHGTEETATV